MQLIKLIYKTTHIYQYTTRMRGILLFYLLTTKDNRTFVFIKYYKYFLHVISDQ